MGSRKPAGSDGGPSAPMWMLTFSDCMTLLLTFFVLLVTFSSFDEEVLGSFASAMRKAFTVIPPSGQPDTSAFLPTEQVWASEELDKGSEKPTLTRGQRGVLKGYTQPVDFHSKRVFLIPSQKVFLGKGMVLSPDGRGILAAMASFLKETDGRIVISESGPQQDQNSRYPGLPRAWAVIDYLVTQHNLAKGRFSISANTTLVRGNIDKSELTQKQTGSGYGESVLEIVLLEQNIYN